MNFKHSLQSSLPLLNPPVISNNLHIAAWIIILKKKKKGGAQTQRGGGGGGVCLQ